MTDKQHAAVCGLFCESCSWYIATTEDPELLARLTSFFGYSLEEGRCFGCRSNKRLGYCDKCKMFSCAAERKIDFCSRCSDFPCSDLEKFRSQMPHRIEILENLERIDTVGCEQWQCEMKEKFTCAQCGTINSPYHIKCRKCSSEPSCSFVAKNRRAIEEFMQNEQRPIRDE